MAAPVITTVYKTYNNLDTYTKDTSNVSSDNHDVVLIKSDPLYNNTSSIKYHNQYTSMIPGDILFISGTADAGYKYHVIKLSGSVASGFALPTESIGNGWKPIGVCAIPASHAKDGFPVIIDIADLPACKLEFDSYKPVIPDSITGLNMLVYELSSVSNKINVLSTPVEYTLIKTGTNNITPVVETGNNNSINPAYFVNNGINSAVSAFPNTATALLHGTLKYKPMHMLDSELSATQLNNIKLPVWPYTTDGYGKVTTGYSTTLLNYNLCGEDNTQILMDYNTYANNSAVWTAVTKRNKTYADMDALNWYIPSFADMCYIVGRWFTIQNVLRMLKANGYTDVSPMIINSKYATSSFLADTTDKRQMIFDAAEAQFTVNSYLNATDVLYRLVSKVRTFR